MSWRLSLSVILAGTLLALSLGTVLAQPAPGEGSEECELFPETGYELCQPFLSYWQDNGGLPVFGYPITDADDELNPDLDQELLTQYFERERMESHPTFAPPYNILLGRLGVEMLELMGRDWWQYPKADPSTPYYQAVTGQAIAPEFYDYYTSHGLEFGDEGVSFRESLALFGYPVSPAMIETNSSGDTVLTQWYERARFEYHPDNEPEFQVLLGRLGSEIRESEPPGQRPQVVVTDILNNRVVKFDGDGTFISRWGSSGSDPSQFAEPVGIATDADNNVYVVDQDNFRIQVFDVNGNFLRQWGSEGSDDGQFSEAIGIAIDRQAGRVYVTDGVLNRVQAFSLDGTFLTKWGTSGRGNGGLNHPRGIGVDAAGQVYVVDADNDGIQVFTADGTFIREWGRPGHGNGQFEDPADIAFDLFGQVYVTDTQNDRVQVFDQTGKYLRQWGSSGTGQGQFRSVGGIVIDSFGQVYVVDVFNFRIQVFDLAGNFLYTWGSEGDGDGEFGAPAYIALITSDEPPADQWPLVYVTDQQNNWVQQFDVH